MATELIRNSLDEKNPINATKLITYTICEQSTNTAIVKIRDNVQIKSNLL